MTEAIQGLEGVAKVVDDVLVYGPYREVHDRRVRALLQMCQVRQISLKLDKCQFAVTEVEFCGYIINANGYRIDPSLVDSIAKFPPPENLTDLRLFMGLVNQVASFNADIADALTSLRPLLKPSNDFVWNEMHQRAFESIKRLLCDTPVLAYFDLTKPTKLYTDASRLNGLGCILTQVRDDGNKRMVQAASRFVTPAES